MSKGRIAIGDILFALVQIYLFSVSLLNFSPVYIVAAILLICMWGISLLMRRKMSWNVYLTGQIVFIVYEFVFTFLGFSRSPSISYSTLMTVVFNSLISIAIVNGIDNNERVFNLIKAYTYIAVFDLLFIIIYTGGTGSEGRLAQNMPRPFSSTGFTAIEVGMLAVWASMCSLYLYSRTKKKRFLLFQVLFWVVIVWSGSRDCYAFGFISIAFLYLFLDSKRNFIEKLKRLTVITILLIIAVIAVLKIPRLYDIIGYRFIGYLRGTEMSAISRQTMRLTAISLIKENPIWGYGLAVFQTMPGSFGTWAHNNYIEMMVSGGIVLTIIYYLPIVVILVLYLKAKKKTQIDYFGISLLFLRLLHELTGVTYLSRMSNFFLLLSIMILVTREKQVVDFENRVN